LKSFFGVVVSLSKKLHPHVHCCRELSGLVFTAKAANQTVMLMSTGKENAVGVIVELWVLQPLFMRPG